MAYAITLLPAIGGHRMVIVEGDIDRAAVPELRAVLAAATSTPRASRLTVDLSAARLQDDSVTACLADATAAALRIGVDFTVLDGGRRPPTRAQSEHAGALALAGA